MTPAVNDNVRRVARELLPRVLDISAQVTERVLSAVPELAPADIPDSVRVVRESTDQNIGAMLSTLAFGITPSSIEPPSGTQDLLRNLVAGGGNLTHLLRAYRVGHELLWQLWSEHVHTATTTADDLHAILRISSAHLFDFIDRACQRIVEENPEALGTTPRPPTQQPTNRVELIEALLGSDPLDLHTAGATLGYDLERHHVALVAVGLTEPADVRHELERVQLAAGGRALAIPSDGGIWWGWLGWATAPTETELSGLAAVEVDNVLIGMGEPGRGRDGLRRSHTQAREAERAGRLTPQHTAKVVRHRDIEIAALLCADPDRARRLAIERLGPLATRDDTSQRLRTTLRALFAHGHNRGHAAAALTVHHKTVAYRIAQAEELLGRSLTDNTFDLHTALLIDLTLHGE